MFPLPGSDPFGDVQRQGAVHPEQPHEGRRDREARDGAGCRAAVRPLRARDGLELRSGEGQAQAVLEAQMGTQALVDGHALPGQPVQQDRDRLHELEVLGRG